jgi:hypothetical protein
MDLEALGVEAEVTRMVQAGQNVQTVQIVRFFGSKKTA